MLPEGSTARFLLFVPLCGLAGPGRLLPLWGPAALGGLPPVPPLPPFFFGIAAPRPTPIGQDNLSTCRLVGATSWNPRSKHLALRCHSTGDLQRAGVLQVKYLPTAAMPSDALTKPLARVLHERHTQVLLGLAPLQWEQQLQQREQENEAAGKAASGWRPGAGGQ